MAELAGKTLIITGASLGIGRALALELAGLGVNLVLNARHPAPLEEAAAATASLGVLVAPVAGNAAAAGTAAALVAQAKGLGGFYGFIHAAGIVNPGPLLWELSPREFREELVPVCKANPWAMRSRDFDNHRNWAAQSDRCSRSSTAGAPGASASGCPCAVHAGLFLSPWRAPAIAMPPIWR